MSRLSSESQSSTIGSSSSLSTPDDVFRARKERRRPIGSDALSLLILNQYRAMVSGSTDSNSKAGDTASSTVVESRQRKESSTISSSAPRPSRVEVKYQIVPRVPREDMKNIERSLQERQDAQPSRSSTSAVAPKLTSGSLSTNSKPNHSSTSSSMLMKKSETEKTQSSPSVPGTTEKDRISSPLSIVPPREDIRKSNSSAVQPAVSATSTSSATATATASLASSLSLRGKSDASKAPSSFGSFGDKQVKFLPEAASQNQAVSKNGNGQLTQTSTPSQPSMGSTRSLLDPRTNSSSQAAFSQTQPQPSAGASAKPLSSTSSFSQNLSQAPKISGASKLTSLSSGSSC